MSCAHCVLESLLFLVCALKLLTNNHSSFSTLNLFAIDVTSCPQLHLSHQLLNMLMNWNPHRFLLKNLDT
ncbi:unnamed protein product [Acanthoscelides obtectus]|uniref:Uncharacterized protein n=1 Tax=Acanthoscelides obtectus TaxID=200917 RepID=A0A9P0LDR3_ACAOB|nr:unnamed protein product [Acanthoscelides obtectus]CAK1651831.1 hypothetical protein AOBTE_LOCUS17485 [Acanthoscelides obtectus]